MGLALLLLGCGKMGGAMARGWLASGTVDRVTIVDPHRPSDPVIAADPRVVWVPEVAALEAPGALDAVILAVKPQMMDGALSALTPKLTGTPLILSIAAGKTIAYFRQYFDAALPLVRSMPNLPAAIGRGVTVCVVTESVTAAHQKLATDLLSACGAVEWVADEKLIDAVTALSGGGPAYVFALIEAMTEAGIAVGLAPDLAGRLARVTVAGAGELVHQSDLPASTLRENVCSPGGTTIEAIKVLMGPDGWQPIITRAITAATRRAEQLGS
ncbi:pyrroline-5-carboxylate reductase [Elstera sp.]|jgi:pyrroline-5-carboxylate reductase|uniref:pyrroline-5-carboxylate reductase n=1 Tax=Elstera sp. TaxID=1916664 RepID=UPI0037C001E6